MYFLSPDDHQPPWIRKTPGRFSSSVWYQMSMRWRTCGPYATVLTTVPWANGAGSATGGGVGLPLLGLPAVRAPVATAPVLVLAVFTSATLVRAFAVPYAPASALSAADLAMPEVRVVPVLAVSATPPVPVF